MRRKRRIRECVRGGELVAPDHMLLAYMVYEVVPKTVLLD